MNSHFDNSEDAGVKDAIRYMLRVRKAAKSHLGNHIALGPGWHLMLAIYTSQDRKKPLHIGSLAVRADLPRTTTIRWLSELQRSGLVILTPDEKDARAIQVELTGSARMDLRRIFAAADAAL